MAQQRRRIKRTWWQALTVLGVLLLGGAAGGTLWLTQPEPERIEREHVGPLVETMRAEREDVSVTVQGHGTVEARVRSSLVPQVSGRVAAVHEQMVAGGFIEAGETLVEIEPEDFQLALDRAETELASARATEETAEAEIAEAEATLADARRELERAEDLVARGAAHQREEERARLAVDVAEAALRRARSSLSTARAQIAAAEVAKEQAAVDLRRTRLTLPFDAVVIEEEVSAGQYVTAGQPVGRVFGTDAVEIAVPLEDREVGWLARMPGAVGQVRRQREERQQAEAAATVGEAGAEGAGDGAAAEGNPATDDASAEDRVVAAEVRGEFFGRWCTWPGRVVRTEGQVDRQSRMVRVVVRVDDPYAGVEAGQVPLMPGAFVEVAMAGRLLEGVIGVPRHALHNGEQVWVADDDGRLRVRQVVVARRERDRVYLAEGVSEGERVIISPLDTVTEGMRIQYADVESPAEPADPAEEEPDGQR